MRRVTRPITRTLEAPPADNEEQPETSRRRVMVVLGDKVSNSIHTSFTLGILFYFVVLRVLVTAATAQTDAIRPRCGGVPRPALRIGFTGFELRCTFTMKSR